MAAGSAPSPVAASQASTDLQGAVALLQSGRAGDAVQILQRLVQGAPSPEALRLLAIAARQLGDLAGAERQLRRAVEIGADQPVLCIMLASLLAETGRPGEAEAWYRRALATDPQATQAGVGLAQVLMAQGRALDALEATSPLVASPRAELSAWTAHGDALKALGRVDEALAAYRRGTEVSPTSAVAEHNLAAFLGDLGRFGESEAASGRAIAKGGQAPETWLVRGRALMGEARLDEAEAAFRESVRRRPGYVEPLAELAQLIWMRTADLAAAAAPLDQAIRMLPAAPGLRICKAKLLEYAGDAAAAYATLADLVADPAADPALHLKAAQVIVEVEPAKAVAHARAALAAAPDNVLFAQTLCSAYLATGDAAEAARLALQLRERAPLDQHVVALLLTAWRMLGDPRADAWTDFETLVVAQQIDTPEGWSSLEAYLEDLAKSLERLHPFKTHPLGQSLRGGSQTQQALDLSTDPAIKAFFGAIDGPIRRYMAGLGAGADPLRARNTQDYRLNGIWSVRLRPNGYHVDHVHPMGWLSSACYIALPPAIERGHEGWLKFGQPGVPTLPALEPQHFVKPAPGRLVLFPSYLWHGTAPFGGAEPRLTIAFDVVPA